MSSAWARVTATGKGIHQVLKRGLNSYRTRTIKAARVCNKTESMSKIVLNEFLAATNSRDNDDATFL